MPQSARKAQSIICIDVMGEFQLVTFEQSVYHSINPDFRNVFSTSLLRSLRAPR